MLHLLTWGPFEVIKKVTKTFTLYMGTHYEVVSVDRLKAHAEEAPAEHQEPPLQQVAGLGGPWPKLCSLLLHALKSGGICGLREAPRCSRVVIH